MTSVSLQQLDNGDVYTSNGTTGNNTSTGTLNVTGCDSAEQITKLFPKCRPRADVNLNPLVVVRSTSSSNNEHDDMNTSPPTMLSPDTPEPLISIQDLNEADRVIEIAGGREIYSQSRTKAARKSRYIGDYADKKKGVWDVRTRCSDSLKHNNPREVTETVFSTEVCSVRHQRPNVHSNNVYTKANSVVPTTEATVVSPSRQMTVVSCGEVVVFDDIGDNWQGLRLDLCQDNNKQQTQAQQQQSQQQQTQSQQIVKLPSSESNDRGTEQSSREDSPNETSQYHRTTTDFFKIVTSVSDFDADSLSPEPNNKVAQMIGNLPIAVYEGSPRRYGPRQPETNTQSNHPTLPSAHSLLASPSVYPPRPGFPQRVVTTPSENEPQQMNSPTSDAENTVHPVNSTFDYLYEFSETRKVLEEFFKCPPENENSLLEETSFQDLDYELHRQAGSGDSGSSYVGQRLAKVRADQNEYLSHMDSPRKPNVSDFPRIQDHEVLEHENNFLDLSVGTGSSGDLGETEVGLQVGHSRNFTLSPETTDCDSNCGDLDSEMSLMLMENELGPSAVGLLGSSGDLVAPTDSLRLYSSMPVLEDGLSSGHASDTDNNNPTVILMKRQITEIEREIIQRSHLNDNNLSSTSKLIENNSKENGSLDRSSPVEILIGNETSVNSFQENETELHNIDPLVSEVTPPPPAPAPHRRPSDVAITEIEESPPDRVEAAIQDIRLALQRTKTLPFTLTNVAPQVSPTEQDSSSPVWVPRQRGMSGASRDSDSVERKAQSGEEAGDEEADTDLETDRLLGQHRTDDQGFYDDKLEWRKPKSRTIMPSSTTKSTPPKPILALSPTQQQAVTVSVGGDRSNGAGTNGCDDSSNNVIPLNCTAIVTNNNPLIQTANNNNSTSSPQPPQSTSPLTEQSNGSPSDKNLSPQSQKGSNTSVKSKKDKENKKKGRNKEGLHEPSVLIEGVLFRARYLGSTQLVCEGQPTKSTRMMQAEEAVSRIKEASNQICQSYRQYGHSSMTSLGSYDNETGMEDNIDDNDDRDSCDNIAPPVSVNSMTTPVEDVSVLSHIPHLTMPVSPAQSQVVPPMALGVGATGTVFRLQFLGSVEVDEEGGRKRRKRLKKVMVEEAVTKIKALAPDGESQPSTEVDLFISTEKIMVLNTDLKEIMMDHALRTISYIADIGDLVVLMARRRLVPHEMEDPPKINRTPKMICHVFESEEAQFIAQSIGQAFQVAYMEFLKANGIEDHSFVKEMDYQEVLNSQEIFGDELQMFAKKEMQKEVVVPKSKGEILGVVIVESGWGSMLPTVVIANLAPAGAAARCGQLNIGDQIIAINGVSLVGLPLSTCQNYIKNSKNQTVVKLTVVPCAPVVEVKIKRPDTKYQLGFSVQNGVICSLLRGGIAERGGVRVGHRIIEINNQSVVAVPHEKIVNLLATSVGEILMKTMPTSMFRLLTGQENPVYI
ncbi:uncharacterized protein LOC123302467 isoform X2 [Chrysoperla carnea]|uniref:uncharacterized protein LOC123302467 isoform X2 n=1 Tax=Chrysoperla carnea TaxID=189513 RepID=UPI001D067AB9|nr:uncharacterized protein LOC123302467 isoform X2 [Chrysoperla carnea]